MKRKVIVRSAVSGVLLLLLGALAAETVNQLYIEPRTVSSWGELVDCYLAARTTLPPLPFAYDDAFTKMETGDWSFLAEHCVNAGRKVRRVAVENRSTCLLITPPSDGCQFLL